MACSAFFTLLIGYWCLAVFCKAHRQDVSVSTETESRVLKEPRGRSIHMSRSGECYHRELGCSVLRNADPGMSEKGA